MDNQKTKLQKTFQLDAMFSAVSAISMITLAPLAMPLIAPDIPVAVMIAVGIGLIPWAAFNFYMSRHDNPNARLFRMNLNGDILWILLSAAIIMFAQQSLTMIGIAAIVGAAVIVADFAWFKYKFRPMTRIASA